MTKFGRFCTAFVSTCVVLLLAPAPGFAQRPQVVKSRITSVGLFKNGLAVVEREVALPGPGVYALEDVPEPVHGTFWIECTAAVETRVTTREEKRPLDGSAAAQLQTDLVGQTVRITFRDNQLPPLEGMVVDNQPASGSDWRRDFEAMDYRYSWWGGYRGATSTPANTLRYLLVQTEQGLTYVDASLIGLMTVHFSVTAKRLVPVIELNVLGVVAAPGKPPAVAANAVTARVSYLAKGLAWAPAYRIDLGSDGKLELRQQAVVRNELEDLDGADVSLITGFPSIEFSHVLSPLAVSTTWAGFFTQLNQRPRTGSDLMRNVVTQQRASYDGSDSSGIDTSLAQVGDGVDVHYHSLGSRRLKEGDSLMVEVAAGNATFERYVEWLVPDTRDAYGRPIAPDNWQRDQNPEREDGDPWDAVRFKNPLDFPLTTGPAMILNNDRFGGQRTLKWVSPGEETSVRINKALSIRTRAVEVEEPGERAIIQNVGRAFRKPVVKGELFIGNHRKEAIQLRIRRQFSGELESADADPTRTLREEGVYAVNPRHELTWNLTVAPGEQRTLQYSYSVLVWH